MEQHFNTPAEVIDNNMKAGEGKAHLPLGKMILLGIMAGAFIALGGATSSTAAHAIDNVGLARFVAGIIFPVGLMIIVFVGGELFTGNCLIVMDVVGKKVTWFECIRNLIVVYFSNLIGALIIDTLIYFSGNLDYTGGLLGAYAIKVAVGKVGISPLKGITSGILCNILVCIAILMAAAATDIVGKVWAIFFPIMAFVVGGFEPCRDTTGQPVCVLFGRLAALCQLRCEVRIKRRHRVWPQAHAVGVSVLALALNGLVVLGVDGLYHCDHILGRYLLGKPQLSQLFSHGRTSFVLDAARPDW